MSLRTLKARVESRDPLVEYAEEAGQALREQALAALSQGDLRVAEEVINRNHATVTALVENLRIYQAELHAQADELADSQSRTEAVLARFSALFGSLPVPALVVAFNGELLEFNARAVDLFHFRATRLPARFLHRLINADQYQRAVRPAFHEARATGASVVESVDFVAEDGRRFHGELHVAALPGAEDGAAPTGQFACVVVDRSEHFEDLRALGAAHDALRVNEDFLDASARLARSGGWEYLPGSDTMHWSKQTRWLLELPDGAVATRHATLALCAPASAELLQAALTEASASAAPFEVELDMQSAAGLPMRMIAVGRPHAGTAGETRVLGVFKDISRQHEASRQIGALTDRLSVANDAGGIGIWDWDLEPDHLYFDARMCALLDLPTPPTADLRATLRRCFDAADAARFEHALQHALVSREPMTVELRLTGAEPERWLHLSGRAQHDAQAKAVRVVGCAWDCTVEKLAARLSSARDSAEEASRSKSAFLSRMSHELRTPLNAILGFSQLMQIEAEAGDLVLKPHRVALIETAARHLLELINEVLDVTRIESGALEVRMARHDLRTIIAECLPMVQGQAQAMNLTLADRCAEGDPQWVMGDRLRLKEVLINLLSNAVKYNRRDGWVDVQAQPAGDGVELSVTDSGHGLSEAQLAGLFQPFDRLGAESSSIEGSGLGLFVSRRFVELMGGQIRVDSQRGTGTRVTVWLRAG